MNILKEADKIINERSEEKERQYGPFIESIKKTSDMASILSGKDISIEDCYHVMIALKLSRHSHKYKEDSLLDAVAYLGSLNNYKQSK